MIGRPAIPLAASQEDQRSPLYTLYLVVLFMFFATHLDVYLGAIGRVPVSLIIAFLVFCTPLPLFLLADQGPPSALARLAQSVQANLAPLSFFALWIVGHVLYLPTLVGTDPEVSYAYYLPAYQLLVLFAGMALGVRADAGSSLRTAGVAAIALLGGTIIYDAFHPGTFSVAGDRAAGIALDANEAGFALLILAAGIVRYGWLRVSDLLVIAFVTLCVILTLSRGGMLLWVIFVLIYAGALLRGTGRSLRLLHTLVFLGGTVLTVVLLDRVVSSMPLFQSTLVAQRFDQIRLRASPIGEDTSRLEAFEFYADKVMRSPFVGYGTGFSLNGNGEAPYGKGPHNMYLRVWSDHGLLGLMSYLGFLLTAWSRFHHAGKIGGGCIIVLILLQGFFSHTLIDTREVLLILGSLLGMTIDRPSASPPVACGVRHLTGRADRP
jgi:O-antigen ligase